MLLTTLFILIGLLALAVPVAAALGAAGRRPHRAPDRGGAERNGARADERAARDLLRNERHPRLPVLAWRGRRPAL